MDGGARRLGKAAGERKEAGRSEALFRPAAERGDERSEARELVARIEKGRQSRRSRVHVWTAVAVVVLVGVALLCQPVSSVARAVHGRFVNGVLTLTTPPGFADALVTINDGGIEVRPDPADAGSYRATGRAGTWTVVMSKGGYAVWETTLAVPRATTMTFALPPLRPGPGITAMAENRVLVQEPARRAPGPAVQAPVTGDTVPLQAQVEAKATEATAPAARQERLAGEQQQGQEALIGLRQMLPGRWYFAQPPANNKRTCTGGYIEFDAISPTGSVSGAFVFPEGKCGHGNQVSFQGRVVSGMRIELTIRVGGKTRVWIGTVDPDSETLTGDVRDTDGSWALRGGWSASKR